MVKTALIAFALLLTFGARAEVPADVRFEIEFTKSEVYAGEPVTAHFVVYGYDDVLEVEVAKFPEFRGYWSENLALRQGPIPMLQDFGLKGWKKSVVGSYLISSMIEEANPTIRPMKLVVRRPQGPGGQGAGDLLLLSEGRPLVVKPLPPLPAAMAGKFSGGVGRFSLQVERAPVLFRKDEPTILRFILSGEGNFREINDIPVPELPDVEVLSRKSYSQGSAQYYTKSFELTLAVHSNDNLTIPSFPFYFFDPVTARYESITVPEIPFLKAPDPVGGPARDNPVDFGAPYTEWSSHNRWIDGTVFWAIQAFLLLAMLISGWRTFAVGEKISLRWRRRTEDPWRPRLDAAQSALKGGDTDGFLAQADRLAFEILSHKVPNPPVTRAELLKRATGHIKEERLHQARSLFEAWGQRAYSPNKPLPPDPGPLLQALQAIVREAA
jgi:hypothetical protein